jgi:hypothetical protein
MVEGALKVRTMAQFRAVVSSGTALVITDIANPLVFHPDPQGCPHVQESSFATKVIENGERNGSYFAVASLAEARRRWPGIAACRSAACSSTAAEESSGTWSQSGDERLQSVLRQATGLSAVRRRREEPAGAEVKPPDWASTQRIALGNSRAGLLVLRTWPGELKTQALAFYGSERWRCLLELVGRGEWTAIPRPHLAYNGSRPADRFYLPCSLSLDDYVRSWARPDHLDKAGGHPLEALGTELWPWLCENRYADADAPGASAERERFTEALRRRRAQAHLRPGLEVSRGCAASLEQEPDALADEVRGAVQELAVALREPLP